MCLAAAAGSCLPKARKGGFTPAQGAHCAAEGGLCSRRSPSAANGAGRRSASVPAVDVFAHVPVPTCMHTHTCTHVSPSRALLQSPLSSAQCAQLFPHQCQGCVEAQHRPAVPPRPPTPLGRAPGATAAWLAWATMQILSSLSVTLTGNRCRPSPACGDPAPAGAEQQVVPLLPCPAHLCVLVHPCPCPRSSGCCAVGWCCPHPQHAVGKRQLPPPPLPAVGIAGPLQALSFRKRLSPGLCQGLEECVGAAAAGRPGAGLCAASNGARPVTRAPSLSSQVAAVQVE